MSRVLFVAAATCIAGAIGCGASSVAARAAEWPTLIIDVGSPSDADPNALAYLDESAGLSERLTRHGRSVRTLDENRTMTFRFGSTDLPLAENGVPYRHAIIDVAYRDTVDENNCHKVESRVVYCRPNIAVRLDYGSDPPIGWHPLRSFGGLGDEEWRTETVFVEANPWQTLRSLDGYFEMRIAYPDQDAAWRPLPIDTITLRFPDETEFHRLREADRAARGLERVEFVDTQAIDPADYDADYVVYSRNYLEKIYPGSVPRPHEISATLSAFEVVGESEPLTFAVYAFRDLRDVTVTVGDLRGPEEQVLAAEHIRVNPVVALDKRWMYGYDEHYGRNPWYLDDNAPFDVRAGESRQVWLTVDVPSDALAGTYTGTVHVGGSAVEPTTLALTLTVITATLDGPDARPYVSHSPYFDRKRYAQSRTTAAANMAEHDVYPVIYVEASVDPASLEIDFHDLETELTDLRERGILPAASKVEIQDNAEGLWSSLCADLATYTGKCAVFDEAYKRVLEEYAEVFGRYGSTPALSFTDEPGRYPDRRMRSNYLNRLTKEVGLDTWVTYMPRCEEPLAGHRLLLDDRAGGVPRAVPQWLSGDPHVRARWDFESGTLDLSPNGNDGALLGNASIVDGTLILPDSTSSMRVPHDDTISFRDEATIYLWMKPAACHTGFAQRPVRKWSSTDDANYVLYLFGDDGGKQPDIEGRLGWRANVDGTYTYVSGRTELDCDEGVGEWYNVVWVYDPERGGQLIVNGVSYPDERTGHLATNTAPLYLGRFVGEMDDVVMLDRALTDEELLALALAVNEGYDKAREVGLRLNVSDAASLPSTLTFAVSQKVESQPELETEKSLRINGRTVWSADAMTRPNEVVAIEIGPHIDPVGGNAFDLTLVNREARHEDLVVYFFEELWRLSDWVVSSVADEGGWRQEFTPDASGSLSPMAPHLDERVHAMDHVSAAAATLTRSEGDDYSYYTTYPANQPVILNNRFLNGIYASALGAESVLTYAYGDWGTQPWDDTEPGTGGRLATTGGRGQGGYQLVLPSWEDRVYDTVVYEALREGIEDSRVIATLRRAIEENPGPLADEAAGYLEAVLAGPSRDYSPRYMHADPRLPIHEYADRSGEILLDLAGDPGAYDFFDQTRRRMLGYITRLRSGGAIFVPFASRG